MSQQPVNNSQPIDIDEIEVEVLIICKNPAAFQQAASFLSRRGWPTTVVGGLSKAIDFVVKNSPDFVLISCNHPNPNVQRLPNLLTQALNTTCIGFAEQGDTASASKLANMPFKHKVLGLPSGPNVQRVIRKILMDMYSPEKAKEGTVIEGEEVTHKPLDIPLESSSQHESSKKMKPSQVLEYAEESAAQQEVTAQEATDDDSIDGGNYKIGRKKARTRLKDLQTRAEGWQEMGGPPTVDPNKKKELLELAKDAQSTRGESGMMFLPTKEEPTINPAEDYVPQHQTKVDNSGLAYIPKPEEASGPSVVAPGAKLGPTMSARQEGPDAHEFNVTQPGLDAKKDPFQPSSYGPAKPGSPLLLETKRKSVGNKQFVGIFEKSIQAALERATVDDRPVANRLQSVEVIGTLPIDSAELHGYLLVCVENIPANLHLEFLRNFRSEMCAQLAENGVQARVDEGFVVTMDEFPFHDWASTEADLGYTVNHMGSELGVVFLPTESRLPEPSEIEKGDMAKINVADIEVDTAVPFKTYLHFKRSDRYYLYLRNGRKLFADQKDRLLTKKVSDFYIKSIDIGNYKTYSAANFISRSTKKYKLPQAS